MEGMLFLWSLFLLWFVFVFFFSVVVVVCMQRLCFVLIKKFCAKYQVLKGVGIYVSNYKLKSSYRKSRHVVEHVCLSLLFLVHLGRTRALSY